MVPKWSQCDPLVIHRNGRGQTGKFRSPNIFWPALESLVLPLSEKRYFIEVRPLTIPLFVIKSCVFLLIYYLCNDFQSVFPSNDCVSCEDNSVDDVEDLRQRSVL